MPNGVARRLPQTPPPLRTQGRALSGLHGHRLRPHLLPPARLLMCSCSSFTASSWP
jgi:hypothetical protein